MASEHETEADYWRVLYEAASARLAEAERWQVAVMSGFDVWQAMGPTTLTASDVANVLDAVAKVARATDSAAAVQDEPSPRYVGRCNRCGQGGIYGRPGENACKWGGCNGTANAVPERDSQ